MGSNSSCQISEEEKRKRGKLKEELRKLDHSLRVAASSHYESSAYYHEIDNKLQYVSLLAGIMDRTFSTLAFRSLVQKCPRRTPALVALSLVSVGLSAAVRIPRVPNSPGTLYNLHFQAGIECQYLQKRVRFMADTTVRDLSVPWGEIASQYEQLLKEKKEANGRIQTEQWAYLKAAEKIREKDNRK